VEVLDETFELPSDFNLEQYVAAEPFFHPRVRVRLTFGPEAAQQALDNRAFWDTLEEQSDGSIIVTFAAHDLEAAAGVVLRAGHQAAVQEPAELVDMVLARARAIIDRHTSSTHTGKEPDLEEAKQGE
jgi:predicted DNA-binding transcriptional regulator YafY